jgi:hypothetical protein
VLALVQHELVDPAAPPVLTRLLAHRVAPDADAAVLVLDVRSFRRP